MTTFILSTKSRKCSILIYKNMDKQQGHRHLFFSVPSGHRQTAVSRILAPPARFRIQSPREQQQQRGDKTHCFIGACTDCLASPLLAPSRLNPSNLIRISGQELGGPSVAARQRETISASVRFFIGKAQMSSIFQLGRPLAQWDCPIDGSYTHRYCCVQRNGVENAPGTQCNMRAAQRVRWASWREHTRGVIVSTHSRPFVRLVKAVQAERPMLVAADVLRLFFFASLWVERRQPQKRPAASERTSVRMLRIIL